jgi:trans-AT polyketide synthase/acyltransferase/oxidoreductase domain-containing protein
MTIAAHFDALADYGSAAIRIVPVEGDPEDLLGAGGQLQEQFDRQGQQALVAVLRDPRVASVTLADGELEVHVARDGGLGRLRVLWAQQPVVDERVEIPPVAPAGSGPWLRPDPRSEISWRQLGEADRCFVVEGLGGELRLYTQGHHGPGPGQVSLRATVPTMRPEDLGAPSFREAHGTRWAYVVGAMAGGIASVDLVVAAAEAGLLAFFGSGGLPGEAVEAAAAALSARLGERVPWGMNLLHNPVEPAVEEHTVDQYLKYGVRRVEASAYMGLTSAVVRYRTHGIHAGPDGRPVCPNRLFAKVSRPEVAEKFLRPPPQDLLDGLVKRGVLTPEQAALARRVPLAEDITGEADSGGHTDHRPFVVLLPSLVALRDRIAAEEGYPRTERPRIGAAGGLGTPTAVYGAFAMGADYVLTGSVNQATREAGTSPIAKEMLSQAAWWEMASGPAPDMFEIGAKVQVLGRGSMYAQRAQKLYDLYKEHGSLEAIPTAEREKLEKQVFKRSIDDIWTDTRAYWMQRDPAVAQRADTDGRHRMALVFRWYLGMTSRWARTGDDDRKRDFQIWCGPAMGGFNEWVKGTSLEPVAHRSVVRVAAALMTGATLVAKVHWLRTTGIPVPDGVVPRGPESARGAGSTPVGG